MTGVDDRQLFARMAGGSPPQAREALRVLYERHGAAVLRFARRMLSDENHAHDILQETFLVVARDAAAFRTGSAKAWLLEIASRRVRDEFRRRRRAQRRERAGARQEAVEDPEVSDELDAALARLPAAQRAALELRVVDGLAHAEVARILGVSLRTTKEWTKLGLARLRELLEGERR